MKSDILSGIIILVLVGLIFFASVVFLFTMADDGTGYNADEEDEEDKNSHTT